MPQNKCCIFFDNNVFCQLTRIDNEQKWNNFYDTQNGLFDQIELEVIYTGMSLIETIGFGRQIQHYRINNQISLANTFTSLKNIFEKCYEHYLREIRSDKLHNKIEQKLQYCTNKATPELVGLTIKEYLLWLQNNPPAVIESIAFQLAWDKICGAFSSINIQKSSPRTKNEIIHNCLFSLWHILRQEEGYEDLSSYRMVDALNKACFNSPEYQVTLRRELNVPIGKSIALPFNLEAGKDLVDVDLISFVTLGKYESTIKGYQPVAAFTQDAYDIIYDRITLQLSVIKGFIAATGVGVTIVPGVVYLLDKDCKIMDKIVIQEIMVKDPKVSVEVKS